MDPNPTLASVSGWPVEDRLELVFRLWDQILDQGIQPPPSEDLAAELKRRLAAHEADPSRVLSWEQVEAHVRRAR